MKHALQVVAVFGMFTAASCGSDDPPSFATYDDCFDKRPLADMPEDKILECCTNATVNDNKQPCGASAADCINYLTDNLAQQKASTVEVMDACTMYADQLKPDDGN
ncbi:MAG TPA: hypothetical protein VGM39_04960 [Kofleriaceae bacterium]|jgi:hypothetical protein